MTHRPGFLTYHPAVDVLAEILDSLHLRGSVYYRSSLARPWRLQFEAHRAAVFHVVERGAALVELESGQTVRLAQGDLLLLPRGSAHLVSDPRETTGARVPRILMRDSDGCQDEIWCQGAPDAVLLCGTFQLGQSDLHALLPLLPEVLHIPSQPWLEALLQLMTLEVSRARPGLETVIRRLSDVLFVQIVRHHLETTSDLPQGWLAGLRDAKISKVLGLMHGSPQTAWTVASLAAGVSLSRSALAGRFTDTMGEPPLEYLTRWRMRLAQGWLAESRVGLLEVANRAGYSSEVAFHRAFKRVTGRTPGDARRQAREAGRS